MRVSAAGAACLLLHRDALTAVEKHAGDVAAPGFRETGAGPLALMGEDMTVCLRCAAAGIPVHVCTGAEAGHMKTPMLIRGDPVAVADLSVLGKHHEVPVAPSF